MGKAAVPNGSVVSSKTSSWSPSRDFQKAGLQCNKKYGSHTAISRNPTNLLEALMGDVHHTSLFSSLVAKVCYTEVFISWDEAA